MFSVLKPCQNCSSFVLKPKKKLGVELEQFIERLEQNMFKIRLYTGTLLSLEKKCKINVYSSGKIIMKTKDSDLVEELKDELSSILYEDIQSN